MARGGRTRLTTRSSGSIQGLCRDAEGHGEHEGVVEDVGKRDGQREEVVLVVEVRVRDVEKGQHARVDDQHQRGRGDGCGEDRLEHVHHDHDELRRQYDELPVAPSVLKSE